MEFQEPKIETKIDGVTFYNSIGSLLDAFTIEGDRNDILLSDKIYDQDWQCDYTFQEYIDGSISKHTVEEANRLKHLGYEVKVALPSANMSKVGMGNIRLLLFRDKI